MLKNVYSVSVPVSDADAALAFYNGLLGMDITQDVVMDEQGNRWIQVAPPGAQTHLVLSTTSGPDGKHEPGGFTSYIFATDDIEATLDDFEQKGVKITVPLTEEAWGRWAQFADPDGNEFGLWSPPG